MRFPGLIALALVVGLTVLPGPAASSSPTVASGSQVDPARGKASTSATTQCSWKWKRKKVVRWVRRHGKKVRIARYRKFRVRVCRTIPDPPPPDPVRLGVKAYEFGFTLTAVQTAAGDTIIELNNQGEDDHNLHVQRLDGGEELATPDTGPGQLNRIRFVTTPGSYRLWCSLPTHAERGMDTRLTVS